jgi:glycosyltransferase involved in cell wall biosynthesis
VLNPIYRVAGDRKGDTETAARLGIREPYVLAVASLEPRKNFGRLLDAWNSLGRPVAEAMACGAPVVTSALSSMPEVVGDGALMVEPERTDDIAAAIERLLGDRTLRGTLRDKGLERARAFSREALVPRLFEVYRRAAL